MAETNHHHINQINLFTIGAIEPSYLFRIINNIKIQPLANDDTFQYVGSGIAKVMRLAPSRIINKITSFILQNRIANARCSGTFKDIHILPRKNAGEGHKTPTRLAPQSDESPIWSIRRFRQAVLQMSRIAAQKMPFVLTSHFGNRCSCDKLLKCHYPASSWKSPDQFNMFKGF